MFEAHIFVVVLLQGRSIIFQMEDGLICIYAYTVRSTKQSQTVLLHIVLINWYIIMYVHSYIMKQISINQPWINKITQNLPTNFMYILFNNSLHGLLMTLWCKINVEHRACQHPLRLSTNTRSTTNITLVNKNCVCQFTLTTNVVRWKYPVKNTY